MNPITKLTVHTAFVFMSISTISSCSHEPKDSKESAEQMNDTKFNNKEERDAESLVKAYASNLFEIKVSENAALNAATADVKKLATMLIEAHTKMNTTVKALAEKKQVTLPTDLTDEQRKKIEDLAERTGMDYDKKYVEMMKEKHEHAINTYEKDADESADNDVKAWANQSLTEVRSHLDMTENTWHNIKDMK
jgi:putative membrane protein